MKTLELTDEEYGHLLTSLQDRVSGLSTYREYLLDKDGNKLPGAEIAIKQVFDEKKEVYNLLIKLYRLGDE